MLLPHIPVGFYAVFFYGILLLRSLNVYNTKNLYRKTFFAFF